MIKKQLLLRKLALSIGLLLVACDESMEISENESIEVSDNKNLEKKKNIDSIKQRNLELEVLKIYQKEMTNVDVEYNADNQIYVMTPIDKALVVDILATFNGQLDISHWDKLVEIFRNASITQQKTLGNGYTIALINPVNTENMILIVSDGVVIYNAFRD